MAQTDVMREGAEQRNSFADENGNSGDYKALHHSFSQEPLNRDASVYVEMVRTAGCKFRNYFSWRASHLFDHTSPHSRKIQGSAAEDYDALVTIGSRRKRQNGFKRIAAYD